MQSFKKPRRNNNTRKKNNKMGYLLRKQSVILKESTELILPISWNVTYQAVGGTAVAQDVSINSTNIYASYPQFSTQIAPFFAEYRVESISCTYSFVPGVDNAGLYLAALWVTSFNSLIAPTASVSGIAKIPGCRALPASGISRANWVADSSVNDRSFWSTAAASGLTGGIVGYISGAAPTTTVVYLVMLVKVKLTVRGRRN